MHILVSSGCHDKMPQTEWFKQQKFISHGSGGWKSKLKMPAGLVSPEASLPGLQMAAFSLCPHMASPLCLCIPGVSLSLLIKTPFVLHSGPTLMTSLNFNYLLKGRISKSSHSGGYAFNIQILGGHNSTHNKARSQTAVD